MFAALVLLSLTGIAINTALGAPDGAILRRRGGETNSKENIQ